MTGQIVAFRTPPTADEREASLGAVVELHTLITLDPILGVSPVRIYFLLNPKAVAKVAACLDTSDRSKARPPIAFALVAYDFPFALYLIESSAPSLRPGRAQEIASRSAGLLGDAFRASATASGIEAYPTPSFNESGLKVAFFPDTQETVTHLFQLGLRGNP